MSQSRTTQLAEFENERLTLAKRVINTDHAYIHEKLGYIMFIEQATVSNSQYAIKTPALKYLHFKNLKMSAAGGTVRFAIRRSTVTNPIDINSAGSTSADVTGPHNMNEYGLASGVVVTKTATYNNAKSGEDWFVGIVQGSATNQFTSIGETSMGENQEFVMKPNSYYIIDIKKVGSDTAANVTMSAFWYEETGGA